MSQSTDSNLIQILPPMDLNDEERKLIFEHLFIKLASYRNERLRFAQAEEIASDVLKRKDEFEKLINEWGDRTAGQVWDACHLDGSEYFVSSILNILTSN